MTRPSIYEYAGGAPAFLALARAHHARCLADEALNHPFSKEDQHPQHVERLAAYWGEVFGGPTAFSTLSDQTTMLQMHAGNAMQDDMGARFVACFVAAADDAALPDDPELRTALRSYMEWAVADVLRYDAPGSIVPDGQPIPHWSWTGLAP